MIHPAGERLLRAEAELITAPSSSDDDVIRVGRGAVALVGRSPARVGARVFDALPDLAIVSATGSGADCIDVAAASERGIPVLHYPGVSPGPVAEYVIAAIVLLLRGLTRADRQLRSGAPWEPKSQYLGREAAGATLGIVGFGHIGREVARLARLALSMRVIVYAPTASDDELGAVGAQRVSLEGLLQQADVVSLHVPLRATTRHLIGAEQLAMMKPTAVLINTARGSVVDEQALIAALQDGTIAGAALDVFETEPTPATNPLLRLPQVLVTPHMGGLTVEGMARLSIAVATAVLGALRGERPPHLVDASVWPPSRPLP
jgi:phosphoglycerate dehydrogenase-like enzyme